VSRIADLFEQLRDCLATTDRNNMFHRYVSPVISAKDVESIAVRGSRTSRRQRLALAWNLFCYEPGRSLLRWIRLTAARIARPIMTATQARGPLVAFVGPDGAGKSTLCEALARDRELRARVIYLGAYGKSLATSGGRSNRGLPGAARRCYTYMRRVVAVRGRLCSALFQSLRGRLVIFDRYVYDSWINRKPAGVWQRFRWSLLNAAWPTPDLVILLDAPGKVLFARKHEHTIEWLEQQRASYRSLAMTLPQMIIVDAEQSAAAVTSSVIEAINEGRVDILPSDKR
jgi:thymidylate kinase